MTFGFQLNYSLIILLFAWLYKLEQFKNNMQHFMSYKNNVQDNNSTAF